MTEQTAAVLLAGFMVLVGSLAIGAAIRELAHSVEVVAAAITAWRVQERVKLKPSPDVSTPHVPEQKVRF